MRNGKPALLGTLALLLGCQATQITVVIDAEPGVRTRVETLTVTVTSQDGSEAFKDTIVVDETTGFPFNVPIVPLGGDAARRVEVRVEVEDGTHVFATETRREGFADGTHREVAILFRDPAPSSREPVVARAPTFQKNTDSAWEDVPGSTLSITPSSPDQVWLVLLSGRAKGASIGTETAPNMQHVRLLANDEELAFFSGAGSAWWVSLHGVYWVTGTTGVVTLSVQMLSNVNGATIEDLRVIAAPLPPAADFQFAEGPGENFVGVTREALVSLEITTAEPEQYLVLASTSASELPSRSSALVQVEDVGAGTRWPAEQLHNPRESMRAISIVREATISGPNHTFTMWARSGGVEGAQATVRHPRIAAFRPAALPHFFAAFDASPPASEAGAPTVLSRLEVPAPPEGAPYVTWQSAMSRLEVADRDPIPQQFLRDGIVVSAPEALQIKDVARHVGAFIDLVEPSAPMTLENVVTASEVRVRSLDSAIYVFGF